MWLRGREDEDVGGMIVVGIVYYNWDGEKNNT